jgi:hypothetical protein
MLEIVLTVCAIANPTNCHDERIKVTDDRITLLQCIMNAPSVLAESKTQSAWKAEHPGWLIAGYQCREPAPSEKDA